MVNRIYPSELRLNKANVSDTGSSFFIYIYLYRMVVLFVLFLLFVFVLSGESRQQQGRGLVDRKLVQAPPPPPPPQYFLLLAVPRRLFCFGSLVMLDVGRCYLWLFTLYINIRIGKIVVKF